MSTLDYYAERVVQTMRDNEISAKKAISKVLNVSFTKPQRAKLFTLIREKNSHHAPADAAKNAHRQKKSLGEDF